MPNRHVLEAQVASLLDLECSIAAQSAADGEKRSSLFGRQVASAGLGASEERTCYSDRTSCCDSARAATKSACRTIPHGHILETQVASLLDLECSVAAQSAADGEERSSLFHRRKAAARPSRQAAASSGESTGHETTAVASQSAEALVISVVCDPLWTVTVDSFIESNCLLFDSAVHSSEAQHEAFKAFRAIAGQTLGELLAARALDRLEFNALCDQVQQTSPRARHALKDLLAVKEFSVFATLMAGHNLKLHQEARAAGGVRATLDPGTATSAVGAGKGGAPNVCVC